VVGWLDQLTLVGYGAVAMRHPLGWHFGPSYTWYKRVWGWWWDSMSEFQVLPNMEILGKSAESHFQMSKRTRHSHIVNGVSRVNRDSLQGWIIHP